MRIGHVRERHAPAGTPWRLAAALDDGERPARWLDLEVARRRLVRLDERLAHNDPLFRVPVTTLDAHLGTSGGEQRGRVAALGALVDPFRSGAVALEEDDDDAVLAAADLIFGPPILRPPSFRDFYAFEGHVATMWRRRDQEVPEAWYRLPIFYFSNTSEIRGDGEPVHAPAGSMELDYELEVGAIVDSPIADVPADRAEDAIGGYTILDDWSARDLQRDETTVRLGPAKGKDFATSIGPWLVTPDELASARVPGAAGPDLAMTASVNGVECSRGSWVDAHFSFGRMLERASTDVRLRPGDLIGSGTVGSGSLLESREGTLGRYLEPGDVVTLAIERLGRLTTPIVARVSDRR
ncbi:MAG TPA: fumarylacetoacetate hydrolase family protein [Candidatus Binatia bacterium]|nr:fumarylacetoacetate hydrolase family protein [Candidatus Binatia bacterium]